MDEVIMKIIEGNTELYREIVQEYYENIYYFIKKQVLNHDDALDITQDIFIKLFQNLKKYDKEKASFKTWMYQIAANYCYDYFRTKTYKNNRLTKELNQDITIYENTLDDLINKELIDQVRNIMGRKLKRKHQVIMQLYYFAELDVSEIAKILNIPVKTIYSILHLSIKKIKLEMRDNFE